MLDGKTYFIEPLVDHKPNEKRQHIHIVHNKGAPSYDSATCGTKVNWMDAWKERFWKRYTGQDDGGPHKIETRGLTSVHRYLETLVVCDKRFLEHHRNTDYETYVLTIMNMVRHSCI